MPFNAFSYRHDAQLRQDPAQDHSVGELDGYPARVESRSPVAANAPNTYPLSDGDELIVELNGTEETITLDAADFTDISIATAAELAAAFEAVEGLGSDPVGSRVRIETEALGPGASLRVVGGSANDALLFPTTEARGQLSRTTLVLGIDQPGVTERLVPGDLVRVSQALTFDESRLVLVGRAHIPELPTGVSWRLSLRVGGVVAHSLTWDTSGTFELGDFGFSAAQQQGAATFEIQLEPLGLPAAGLDVELPRVLIDLVRSVNTDQVQVLNRSPLPGQLDVDASSGLTIELDLASALPGVAVDVAATAVLIDGVLAFDGTNILAPWDAPGSAVTAGQIYNVGATDLRLVFVSAEIFESEQVVGVVVDTQHVGAATNTQASWTFTTADTVDLAVVEAQARDKLTVRVTFNDDVGAGALLPANYLFETLTAPAVTVVAQSVAAVGTTAVDVTVDLEWSQGASYRVTVVNVQDTSENPLDADASTAEFAGFLPEIPAGRFFQLWEFFPGISRRGDDTDDLRNWVGCLQDVVDLLLCSIDEWVEIIDIDLAPITFIDAILCDLGNPFDFVELSDTDKRRLALILIEIYKGKGTEVGLIDAVRFLVGVEITLDIINAQTGFWVVGVSELGIDTELAPPTGSPLWYSFWIDSPVDLTDEQRDQILKIATYMKAAHEHILGIREPSTTDDTDPVYWNLEIPTLGELGKTTILGD